MSSRLRSRRRSSSSSRSKSASIRVILNRLSRGELLALAIVGGGLSWFVATTSLPTVLASTAPDTALLLNPNQPEALIIKAEAARRRLLEALTVSQAPQTAPPGKGDATVTKQAPEAGSLSPPRTSLDNSQRDALRSEIRDLATRVLKQEPLNARALSMLGEVADKVEDARRYMEAAVERSRGETRAVAWLMNDSFERKDFAATIRYCDIVLRTSHRLNAIAATYLGLVTEDEEGRKMLAAHMAVDANSKVRALIFNLLPSKIRNPSTPLLLMKDLKALGAPPSNAELKPYVEALIARNDVEAAYFAWLEFLPEAKLATVGRVQNGGFDEEFSGLPFDWQAARPLNASIEFPTVDTGTVGRAVHIRFGTGRVRFPTLSQLTMLPAGDYQLTAQFRGNLTGKRGLRWRVACLQKQNIPIAETEMLLGNQPEWRMVVLDLKIPDQAGCRAQRLSLIHDARSASEQLISGEAWFDAIEISPRAPKGN